MVGTSIENRYRILGTVGEGGMGQVYEAVEQCSGRRVAIKILHAAHRTDGEILARFRAEADALKMASHPGIVELYAEGMLPSGELFIVMELLNGQTLHRLLLGGKLELELSLAIAAQLAAVLTKVHSHKIVHRDLKPENIMLLGSATAMPVVKVLDFGIAKLSAVMTPRTQIRTRTGVFFGTPAYMAPEQCGGEGETCDRTDVYAVGSVLYEMLAGRPPFVGQTDQQLIGQQLFQLPPPLRLLNQKVPADVELLVHAMLAKRPKQRPSMSTVAAIVEALARGEQLSETHTTALRLLREAETVRYGAERPARRQLSARESWFVVGIGSLVFVLVFAIVRLSAAKFPPPLPPVPLLSLSHGTARPTIPTVSTAPGGEQPTPKRIEQHASLKPSASKVKKSPNRLRRKTGEIKGDPVPTDQKDVQLRTYQ